MKVLLDRPREDTHEHDAIGLHADDLGHGRLRLGIPDDDEGTRCESDACLKVIDMRMSEPVAVTPVVVQPQIEPDGHHCQRTGPKPGFGVAAPKDRSRRSMVLSSMSASTMS